MASTTLQAPSVLKILTARILPLILLFGIEAIVATTLLDGGTPAPAGAWLTGLVHGWGSWVARGLIGFAALFATFAYLRYPVELRRASDRLDGVPVNWALLGGHGIAMALFAAISPSVYGGQLSAPSSNLASAVWILTATAAIVMGACAFVPWHIWSEVARSTGWLGVYAAAATLAASLATAFSRSLWEPTSRVTFQLVKFFASPFLTDMVVQPAARRIGTHQFTVVIADECSGLEGIALLLVFGVIWLIVFRDEVRFPRALVLLPAGVAVLFLLNALRITALILIGVAGAKDIAIGGFHSQAGWVAFNSVAFGLSVTARRIPWFAVHARQPAEPANPAYEATAAFLAPFLAILAAGMVSTSLSGKFEWAYPLRFFAALGVLWIFRRSYSKLDWHAGWSAPLVGILVFAIWIGLDRWSGAHTGMPAALAAAPPATRLGWIVLRVLGAVATVPIAEELAFRGFLLRRFLSADFEEVSSRSFTWWALLASSLIFGVMHGPRWPAATLAGLLYGLVLVRRGRIGDAVLAHATTNALVAIWVLEFGQWQLW